MRVQVPLSAPIDMEHEAIAECAKHAVVLIDCKCGISARLDEHVCFMFGDIYYIWTGENLSGVYKQPMGTLVYDKPIENWAFVAQITYEGGEPKYYGCYGNEQYMWNLTR